MMALGWPRLEWLSPWRRTHQRTTKKEHALSDQQRSDVTPGFEDDIIRWVRLAVEAAEDKLGQRTDAFFVGDVLAITDWFVITSGRNNRQVRAIVDGIEEAVTRAGGPKPVRIEGRDTMSWVLMDYGFFVVHVFTDEAREYYDLERLWRDVPRLEQSA
jgi:ribosome-associated protein